MERDNPDVSVMRDAELHLVQHDDGPVHAHAEGTQVPGVYHASLYVVGTYCPDHTAAEPSTHQEGGHHANHGAGCQLEPFTRILTTTVALMAE